MDWGLVWEKKKLERIQRLNVEGWPQLYTVLEEDSALKESDPDLLKETKGQDLAGSVRTDHTQERQSGLNRTVSGGCHTSTSLIHLWSILGRAKLQSYPVSVVKLLNGREVAWALERSSRTVSSPRFTTPWRIGEDLVTIFFLDGRCICSFHSQRRKRDCEKMSRFFLP